MGGVEIDVCQGGCGGIWFDAFELEKMDEPGESAGQLLDNTRVDLSVSIDVDGRIHCPRCDDVTLTRQPHPTNQSTKIDKCPGCGGVWLDFGELFAIRDGNHGTAANRQTTVELLSGLRGG